MTEDRLRLAVEAAGIGTWAYQPGTGMVEVSERSRELLRLPEGPRATFDQLLASVHPDDRGAASEAIRRALGSDADGRIAVEVRVAGADPGGARWVAATGRAFRDDAGRRVRLVGIVEDVTARKRDELELHRRARQAALVAEVGTALSSVGDLRSRLQRCAEAIVLHLDAAFARLWMVDETGRTLVLQASAGLYTHLDGAHARIPVGQFKIGRIAQESRPHISDDIANDPLIGDPAWARREGLVAFAGFPLMVHGTLVGVMATFARRAVEPAMIDALASSAGSIGVAMLQAMIEVERDRSLARERTARDEAETLLRVGALLAAELDRERLVQSVTDAARSISGAEIGAFFYTVTDADGERFTLYTLSGAPREAFGGLPMPRNTAIFAPTFDAEGIVRIDDVRTDPRYGKNVPFFGMPPGHPPVRSYLAVPVISRNGDPVGGLFFGHARPGVFTERAERLVAGIADQAAISLDNARLYSAERAAQAELRAQAEQLRAANRELEAFSYSVSHDLRSPLRAMDGFSRILVEEHADQLDEQGRRYLQIVQDNARQMGSLVDDLLQFSRLGRQMLKLERVEPATLARQAWQDLRHEWAGRDVALEIGALPPAEADPTLLRLVFLNLFGNAVKFTRGRTPATIAVSGEPLEGGGVVYRVRDNGVGFSMKYADKLFGVFQRLHRAEEYEGTGVGLAIVQRIVARHGGRVWAESEPDRGATFSFTLGEASADDR